MYHIDLKVYRSQSQQRRRTEADLTGEEVSGVRVERNVFDRKKVTKMRKLLH